MRLEQDFVGKNPGPGFDRFLCEYSTAFPSACSYIGQVPRVLQRYPLISHIMTMCCELGGILRERYVMASKLRFHEVSLEDEARQILSSREVRGIIAL